MANIYKGLVSFLFERPKMGMFDRNPKHGYYTFIAQWRKQKNVDINLIIESIKTFPILLVTA